MKKKAIIGIVIGIVVIVGCVFLIFNRNQKATVKQGSHQSAMGLTIKKNKRNTRSRNNQNSQPNIQKTTENNDQYSIDEWMLMGYMAYAHDNYVQSRHIKNNAELVDDISEDLNNGDLSAKRNSSNTYTLTNKFGSVDVEVEKDDVKVTNDGETINAKSELKEKFGAYADKIKAMIKNISQGSHVTDNEKSSSATKSKIPQFSIKQLAIFAGFARGDKEWVRDCIKKSNKLDPTNLMGTMCVGYNSKKTAYYIDGHGDPTTIVEFKREGDILITKHNDLTGQSVGNSPMITKRIPLTKLVEKYYSTDDEKAEVDNLANRLLTQQQYDAKLKAASNK